MLIAHLKKVCAASMALHLAHQWPRANSRSPSATRLAIAPSSAWIFVARPSAQRTVPASGASRRWNPTAEHCAKPARASRKVLEQGRHCRKKIRWCAKSQPLEPLAKLRRPGRVYGFCVVQREGLLMQVMACGSAHCNLDAAWPSAAFNRRSTDPLAAT